MAGIGRIAEETAKTEGQKRLEKFIRECNLKPRRRKKSKRLVPLGEA